MSTPFRRLLNQTAVYWGPGTIDKYGNTGWDAGVEIDVRWEDRNDEIISLVGEKEVSRAVIYMDGQEGIELDGRMYLGFKSGLEAAQVTDPTKIANVFRVLAIKDSPDVRNRMSLKKVWVGR